MKNGISAIKEKISSQGPYNIELIEHYLEKRAGS
jgi:hypothetical protein